MDSIQNENADHILGQTLAGYRIEGLLGSGKTGTVYKATQLSIERTVALRVLAPNLARDRKFVVGFVAEARAAARLNHPHVVQIHDVLHADKYLFYSMEYLPGGSLASLLRREGRVPWRVLLQMMRDATRALLYAEQNQIVHGDINPDNLLLTQERRVKVADLGITAELERSLGLSQKRPLASLYHMAPEQALGKKVDHRADIYALGSTFFHALTGGVPFPGKSAKEILAAKTAKETSSLPAAAADVPHWLLALIQKLMARDPVDRPQSFAEVLQSLDQQILELQGQARPGGGGSSGTTTPGGLFTTLRAKVALGFAAMVCVALLLFVFLGGPKEAPESSTNVTDAQRPPGAAEPGAVSPKADEDNAPGPQSPAPAAGEAESQPAAEPAAKPNPPEKPTPPEKPAGVQAAALKEMKVVRDNLDAGLLTAAEAVGAIESLKQKYSDPVVTEAAGRLLEEVRKKAPATPVEDHRKVIEKFFAAKVAPEVEAGRYAEAAGLLEDLRGRLPEAISEIDNVAARVLAAARSELDGKEAQAGSLATAGDFPAAIELLKALEPRLPAALRPEAAKKAAEVEAAREQFKSGVEELEKAGRLLAASLAALDFDAAAAAVPALPEHPHPLYAARRGRLADEARFCRETWEKLLQGLERAKGTDIKLGFHPQAEAGKESPRSVSSYRLKDALKAGNTVTLTLQGEGARTEDRDLFSLDDPSLFEFLRLKPPGDESGGAAFPPPPLVEGLGLLLLHLTGPGRADGHLVKNTILEEEKRAYYAARVLEVGRAHLEARLAQGKARLAELVEKKTATPDKDLTDLADRLGQLILEHRSFPYYHGLKSELARCFVEAKKEALRREGTRPLLHARGVKQGADGKLELNYDFSSEDQLEDFIAVGAGASKTLERKMLKLRGEFRLLRGDPFRHWLAVKAEVSRYNASAPNINLALWTREKDKVTYDGSLPTISSAARNDEDPGDYLVFGIGYQPRTTYSDSLKIGFTGFVVPTPCFAIIGGARGRMLHPSYPWVCLWGESILNKVQGPQVVQVLLKPGSFDWYANRTRLSQRAYEKDPEILKRLMRSDSTGSLTIFTNGEWVHYDSLKVEGDLNPAWLEEEHGRRAEAALKKIEPAYPYKE